MRIARANKADLEAALDLLGLLDTLSRGFYPSRTDDDTETDPLYFDEDDPTHLAQLWQRLKTCLNAAPGFQGRVIGGAHTLMSPGNALIDPDRDWLDLHPRLELALKHSACLTLLTTPRKAARWHPRMGPVLWWTDPISGPPYLGRRRDKGWSERHTHWTPLPAPAPAPAPAPEPATNGVSH